MLNLDIFQPKNHIWHIKVNLVFPAVSPLSIAKAPYSIKLVKTIAIIVDIAYDILPNPIIATVRPFY